MEAGMVERLITLFKPQTDCEDAKAVARVLSSGWLGKGPETAQFERDFAAYLHVPHVVATNSGTAALQLALMAAGVKRGDEVIVPSYTFCADGHVCRYVGATPVFADCGGGAWPYNVDADSIAARVTKRTKAIIVVHFAGVPVDTRAIRNHPVIPDVPIIEDCAHACGTDTPRGKAGTLADLAAFSFHAVKNLGIGDGGAVVCHGAAMADRLRRLSWMGIDSDTARRTSDTGYKWGYDINEIGLKCHANDVNMAIARVRLRHLDRDNDARREIARVYAEKLNLPYERTDACHLVPVLVSDRDGAIADLTWHGIHAGAHYRPLHTYPVYDRADHCPVADGLYARELSLPCWPGMSPEQAAEIAAIVRRHM